MLALLLSGLVLAQAPSEESGGVRFRGALEVGAESFPSGPPGGAQDLLGVVTPLIAVDTGDDFGFELGASLRLLVFDDPPYERASDYGGVLRAADWNELSDFGQILRQLKIGAADGPFWIRAGPLRSFTLGRGHVVNRYTNLSNPNYHPAGAELTAAIGAARLQAFASDILGARLFAGELSFDLARLFSSNADLFDRYHANATVAHDFGLAGGTIAPITILELEADAALYRVTGFQLFGYLGAGGRMLQGAPNLGALIGLAADGTVGAISLSGKLEGRKVGAGFRFGMFGAAYELSRFSGIGLAGVPIAAEQLPDGYSGYAEGALSWGSSDVWGLDPFVRLSAAVEQFSWGRTDVDGAVSARAFEGKGLLSARATLTGLGEDPRYAVSADLRYRFAASFYMLAMTGTVFFPQPNGSLAHGVFAGVGLGADFAR